MKKQLLLSAMACSMAGGTISAQAEPWTRGFVVGAYEYAFRYGGQLGLRAAARRSSRGWTARMAALFISPILTRPRSR